eukprot:g13293.t1
MRRPAPRRRRFHRRRRNGPTPWTLCRARARMLRGAPAARMTSLPSRLRGACAALKSIAAQTKTPICSGGIPDRLILSLPRCSIREGRAYEIPRELQELTSEHPWMQVHWLEEDFGPGTKLLGVIDWKYLGDPVNGDMLMLLDDDHAYLPHAIDDLWHKQSSLGTEYVSSYFAKEVRSFRDSVLRRGVETIYTKTSNASVEALMDLEGAARRDRAMLACFDHLLQRLLAVPPGSPSLECIGGAPSALRLRRLAAEVALAERRMAELHAESASAERAPRAAAELAKLRHLYLMQGEDQRDRFRPPMARQVSEPRHSLQMEREVPRELPSEVSGPSYQELLAENRRLRDEMSELRLELEKCGSDRRWIPLLLIAVSALGFSIQALMVQYLTKQGIGTFQVLILRGTCQALGSCCCLSFKGLPVHRWLGATALERFALFGRAFVGYGGVCFGFLAIALMPLADSQILGQTAPIFSAGRVALLRVRQCCGQHCWSGLHLEAGILEPWTGAVLRFLAARGAVCGSVQHLSGVLFGLLSSLSAGGAYVIIKFLGTAKVDWASVLFAQALGQIFSSPIGLFISGQQLRLFSRPQLAIALAIGTAGFLSQMAMTKGMQKEPQWSDSPPKKSATSSLVRQSLGPVFALLWQGLFFPTDALTWSTFAGFGTILLGIIVTVVAKAYREEAPQTYVSVEPKEELERNKEEPEDVNESGIVYGKRPKELQEHGP